MNPTLLTCIIIFGSAIVLAGALYGILYLMCIVPPKNSNCPKCTQTPCPTLLYTIKGDGTEMQEDMNEGE